jgi:Mg-chelatase subunit ChlD/uncharacterized membrane protein
MKIAFIYPHFLWLLLLIPLTVGLALLGRRGMTRRRLWAGVTLRSVVLALIVLALAGIQVQLPAETLSVVFVLDVSDSISPTEQTRGEAFIRDAVNAMPNGDRAAVVVFGQDALVERLATVEQALPRLASVPVSSRTDIAGAIQLALALFPDEGAKRMVLLSDGRENLGAAVQQAELAAAHRIELLYVPLGEEDSDAEVLVEALESPADIRLGQEFDLNVVVRSTVNTSAELRVYGDSVLIYSENVTLSVGANRFTVPVEASETGFRRYRAQIVPNTDSRLQNNEASAFTVVHGPPRVLLVEALANEGLNLAEALEAAEMEVDRLPPAQMPNTLPELASYDAVVLVNVPAPALPDGVMDILPVYVRDLGKGLLMTGGELSFGAGGYLRTPIEAALPVQMDVRNKEMSANLALVLVVDKSGSMGQCHCDDPNLNQNYDRVAVGQPKVDIAKEAIMRSAGALGEQDYLGVVTYDDRARWALQISPLVDPYTLEGAIGTFTADGSSNMRAGVENAYEALKGVDARRKHIILMTDGWVREGELTQMAREMSEQGITLSVVAAGEGSARYLEELAEAGNGRYYPAENILGVPDIFLKETVTSVGEYIIEEPFFPLPGNISPILRGLDENALPALLGYNGTTAKRTARLDLLTPRGDPLLISWQFGLGRSVAWTSDLKGQWARDWMAWEGFSRFASQLVGWALPTPQEEGYSAVATIQDGKAVVRFTALDENGEPINFLDATATIIRPDLTTQEVRLSQVGPGQYEASVDANQTGSYLAYLGVSEDGRPVSQMILGVVVPYSPEYRTGGVNIPLLSELARITGATQGELTEALNTFLHNLPAADFVREFWRPLLLLAALLFPIDVAVRRVVLGREDLRRARAWFANMRLGRLRQAGEPRVLGDLFQARERARRRQSTPDRPAINIPIEKPKAEESSKPEEGPPAEPPSSAEALSRLREAKRRARGGK